MRTELERMYIEDAYDLPDGTPVVLCRDGIFIDEVHLCKASLNLDTAHVYTVENHRVGDSSGWRWDVQAILFTEETPEQMAEQLAKLPLGQRLSIFIDESPPPTKEDGYTKEKAMSEALRLAESIKSVITIKSTQAAILLALPRFKEQFLSPDEVRMVSDILNRIVAHYQQVKPQTPNSKLIDALTNEGVDSIF